jgi:hypothetical protein
MMSLTAATKVDWTLVICLAKEKKLPNQHHTIKSLIARMQEPGRSSVTLGRSDMAVVLPLLKKELEQE